MGISLTWLRRNTVTVRQNTGLAKELWSVLPERYLVTLVQHRAKIVQYPIAEGSSDQGVGPHYDARFLTFLLQASPHRGLQGQNLAGDWIYVPPIPGTLVVNIGKALEFVTGGLGLARATSESHVLSPKGTTPRYSVPFFQNIGLSIRLADQIIKFPPEISKLREERGHVSATDSVNFSKFDREPSGKANLIGRVKDYLSTFFLYASRWFSGVILTLTWASEIIILNSLSKSSPTDILERKLLTSDRILNDDLQIFCDSRRIQPLLYM